MVGRLRIIETATGTDINVEVCGHDYRRHFQLRESAIACLVANGYFRGPGNSAQCAAAFSTVGTEINTTSNILLHQGYIRAD